MRNCVHKIIDESAKFNEVRNKHSILEQLQIQQVAKELTNQVASLVSCDPEVVES